jgi:hypothetical protein
MSSLAQYSSWHKAYAGLKGAVKDPPGKSSATRNQRLKAKPTKPPATCKRQSARIEGCGARKIGHYHQRRLPMELLLIIVVLLLLFGGGGGYFGRRRGYW